MFFVQSEIAEKRQSSREKDRPIITDEKFEIHPMEQLTLDEDCQSHDRYEEERQTDRQIRIVQLKIILEKQMNQLKQKEEQVFFPYSIDSSTHSTISSLVTFIQTGRRISS